MVKLKVLPEMSSSGWNAKCIVIVMGRRQEMIEEINKLPTEFSTHVLEEFLGRGKCGVDLHVVPALKTCHSTRLGSGGFGDVFGITSQAGQFAVKCQNSFSTKEQQERANMSIAFETAVLKGLQHPHIIKVYGHYGEETKPPSYDMVMEWMNGGSLIDWVKQHHLEGKGHLVDERMIRHLMKQALEALAYLHEPIHTDPFGRENMTIVHHDVKPHNMLIHVGDDGVPVLKLADFGWSRFDRYHNLMRFSSIGGTVGYLPKESQPQTTKRTKLQYTPASDMYSWAKSFVEAAACRSLREELTADVSTDNFFCSISLVPQAKDLLRKCLDPDPNRRPSTTELLQDEYFARDDLFDTWFQQAPVSTALDSAAEAALDEISIHFTEIASSGTTTVMINEGGTSKAKCQKHLEGQLSRMSQVKRYDLLVPTSLSISTHL